MHGLKVLVVIVDYFKAPRVVEAIRSIRNQAYAQELIAIRVIDNSCCASNFETLQAMRDDALIERSPSNLGYVAAVNQAVVQHTDAVDVVLLFNPDIVLRDERTLERMLDNFRDPACHIVGPAQVNEDGSRPSIARGYPSLSALVAKRTALGQTSWGRRQVDVYLLSGFDHEQRQQVPWLQSSCVFVRACFWREAGGLDPRYFLFMADIVICQQAYQRGGYVLYDPSATVEADGRRCSEGGVKALWSSRALRMHVRDAVLYYLRHIVLGYGVRIGMFLLCCLTLAYGLFRSEPAPHLFEHSDKWLHVMAFGGLTLCTRLAFSRTRLAILGGVLMLLAPALEWLQHDWQPMREFSLGDVVANVIGVALGLMVCWWIKKR